MIRVNTIVALVALWATPGAKPQPDLGGQWILASATTTLGRDGSRGEQPTKTYVSDGWAFNCGRQCRIVQQGSTLTIEDARFDGATAPSPTVTIVVDGQPHMVVDTITLGDTIQTVGRWEGDRLSITSMLLGKPMSQTISLEQGQLVVETLFTTSDGKLTFRYTKK